MIECEIHLPSGSLLAFNKSFSVLPRIGEDVVISINNDDHTIRLVVKEIVHIALDTHGNDARPNIQLWLANA